MKRFLSAFLALVLLAQPAFATTVLLTGAGTGSLGPTATPISNACSIVSGTVTTFTAQGIGNAKPSRISVVSINWDDSTLAGTAELTGVTLGGVAMSRAARAVGDDQNSNAEIWYLSTPTGTSANIVVTSSTAIDGITIEVYSLVGYGSVAPVASTTGTTSVSQAYTNKQIALAAASRRVNVSTSLSNMTNDFSSACGSNLWGVHASQRLNGSGTLSSTISPTSNTPLIALAVWAVPAPAVCTEATTFLARTSGIDTLHQTGYRNLICGLVTDGIWAKLDMLHVYATQDSTTALLNLVSTSFNGTANGSPTFTADRGFTGATGSSKWIATGFSPAPAGFQFTQNSAHISAWSLTSSAVATAMMGNFDSINSSETNIFPKLNDGSAYGRVNSSPIAGVAIADSVGHYIATRPNSTTVTDYKNGSSILTNSSAPSALGTAYPFIVLGYNSNGTPTGGAYQVAMASIGASLSGTDATNFYNRLRTYMTLVGVP